jgi:hypothetical protein
MTELLSRVRDYFVEIDERGPPAPVLRRRRVAPDAVGLVGPPRLTAATGAALALALARLHGARCAILCRLPEPGAGEPAAVAAASQRAPGGAPAVPAARRAAASLRAHDLAADAAGRLVRVTFADDAPIGATATRVIAAVPGPVVLAVDRPRDDGIDRALAEQDAVAWLMPEGTEPSLIGVGNRSLEALGPPVFSVRPPSALVRRLALSGVASPGLAALLLGELDGAAA